MHKEDLLNLNRQEITANAKKRMVQKKIDSCDGREEQEKALKQEQERLRLEKEKKEREEEEKRRQSKERLKQKASLWN